MGAVPWQRCQFHLQRNAQACLPRLEQRAEVARAIRSLFECASRATAEQRLNELLTHYAQRAPTLAPWREENLPPGCTGFPLPAAHQPRLRTAKALERVNPELKGRTRVARVFANDTSLLRLITARLSETSDEGETGKTYLAMENQTPPSV